MLENSIFKTYDIRGRYPSEINEEIVYKIGQALVEFLKADSLVVGCDLRNSSKNLKDSLVNGIISQGCDVIDLGPLPNGLLALAISQQKLDGGVIITASHLGKEYNGLKLFDSSGQPIALDSGFKEIKKMIQKEIPLSPEKGYLHQKDISYDYLNFLFNFTDPKSISPLKIVLDASAGPINRFASAVFAELSCQVTKINFHPNDKFLDHSLNPLLEESQREAKKEILSRKADLGVIWDGDGDRAIFLDEKGKFVEPYFITALLAEIILRENPKAKILYDPRLTWAIEETIKKNEGVPVISRAGWSNFLPKMLKEKILFGGEASGHYFFLRESFVIGDGLIPVLLILKHLSQTKKKISQLVEPLRQKYFISGERNFKISSPEKILNALEKKYSDASQISHLDGLSVEYNDSPAGEWRFNLRPSQTESLMRLNIEAKSQVLLKEKIRELEKVINSHS